GLLRSRGSGCQILSAPRGLIRRAIGGRNCGFAELPRRFAERKTCVLRQRGIGALRGGNLVALAAAAATAPPAPPSPPAPSLGVLAQIDRRLLAGAGRRGIGRLGLAHGAGLGGLAEIRAEIRAESRLRGRC